MARGLWRTHAHIRAGDTASVPPNALAQLPTLTARMQLAQLGITSGWSQGGPRERKRRKVQTAWADRVGAGNQSPPDVVGGKLVADPAYMAPMWEVGSTALRIRGLRHGRWGQDPDVCGAATQAQQQTP
eukprot:9479002-Pyramimonas_sp.AAC.1